jgi:UPF0755 protein
MVGEFRHIFSDSLQQRLAVVDLTLHEAVTLASIVEREAQAQDERPVISGVFLRRRGNASRRRVSPADGVDPP